MSRASSNHMAYCRAGSIVYNEIHIQVYQVAEAIKAMGIIKDPEGIETATLHRMVDLSSLNVLEIGSGDGRFTLRYAYKTARVTCIDPDTELLEKARQNLPPGLRDRIMHVETSLDDFVASSPLNTYDIAIFSWSL